MTDTTSHVFVPTGSGACAVCRLSVHAEVHGGYPQVCTTCGHATPHRAAGIGVCEFADCGCDGPVAREQRNRARVEMVQLGEEMLTTPPKPKDVLHLCDRCHGEVYTFPERVIGLAQRHIDPEYRFSDFVYTDSDGDELVISDAADDRVDPEVPGINIHTTPDGVFVPLDVLEAVVAAIRESGLRSLEGDET